MRNGYRVQTLSYVQGQIRYRFAVTRLCHYAQMLKLHSKLLVYLLNIVSVINEYMLKLDKTTLYSAKQTVQQTVVFPHVIFLQNVYLRFHKKEVNVKCHRFESLQPEE